MKSALRLLAFVVSVLIPYQVLAIDHEDMSVDSNAITFNSGGQISGPLLAVKAYQALRDRNAGALLHALSSSPSPVNQALRVVIDGHDVKLRLIHIAVLMKDPIMIGLLSTFDARLGAKDSRGRNAAHYASFGANELASIFSFEPFVDSEVASAVLDFLHSQSVDFNATDDALRTPLHYAAEVGDSVVLSTLIRLSANLDAIDKYGFTPKQTAIRSRLHLTISSLLSQAGSTSRLSWSDIAVGMKNRAKTLALAYPIVAVGTGISLLVATAAIVPNLFGSNNKPTDNHDLDNDDFSNDNGNSPVTLLNLKLPQAPALILGHSSSSSMVVPAKPILAKSVKQNIITETLITDAPKVITTNQRLTTATRKLNGARVAGTNFEITQALAQAEALLQEVSSIELDKEDVANCRHLVAAINAITKLKSASAGILVEVNRLLQTYAKYRHKK